MKQVVLSFKNRKVENRSFLKNLRKLGQLPCVIYSKEINQLGSLDEKEFKDKKIWNIHSLLTLKDENEHTYSVIVKDICWDYLNDKVVHVDFFHVQADKPIHATVNVVLEGVPLGVRQGLALLETHAHTVEVLCLPADIPETIKVNVEKLNVGDSVFVSDLPQSKKYQYVTDSTVSIAIMSAVKKVLASDQTTEQE